MDPSKLKYWVIIPAAGIGERMKKAMPKQYCKIDEKTVLEHCLIPFIQHSLIQKIIVVLNKQDTLWPTLEISNHPKIEITFGGKYRAQSVFNGLLHLQTLGARTRDWVLVHDAVRPCLTLQMLDHLIENLKDDKVGGLLATPVRDTLKRVLDHRVEKTISRENLWCAQTPQMFRHGLLFEALEKTLTGRSLITDEAIAVENFGKQAKVVVGDIKNIKITFPEDLELAKLYIDKL